MLFGPVIRCAMCGETVALEDLWARESLVPQGHRLQRFFGAGFHRRCVEADPEGGDAMRLCALYDAINRSLPKFPGTHEEWVALPHEVQLKYLKRIDTAREVAFWNWPPSEFD